MEDASSCECSDNESEEFVSERLPSSNNVIRGQKDAYAVGKKIAPGKYGAVYEVLRRRDGRMFAAKLEVCDVAVLKALNMDYVVLKAANKAKLGHFCTLVDRGMIKDHFKFLVMNRASPGTGSRTDNPRLFSDLFVQLGDNLHKLRVQFQHSRFSAPTALRLALEMLSALEQLHSLGYVHRDVKPSNFALLEEKGQPSRVFLLDFGLCRLFRTPAGGIKVPRENTQFRGSARYASLTAHRAKEQSPKDDLESWLYVIIEFMNGELPWAHIAASEKDAVRKAKEHARTHDGMVNLFKYCPRMEFKRIMAYLDGLQYSSMPDYQYLRDVVILAMRNHDIRQDEPYDWEQQETESTSEALATSSVTEMNGGRRETKANVSNGPVIGGMKQYQNSQQMNNSVQKEEEGEVIWKSKPVA